MSNIDASADSVEELEPVVARIRQRWPKVKIWLRGDGGFCREKLMVWCEREGMEVQGSVRDDNETGLFRRAQRRAMR
jgi:hypothetical protein